MKCRWATSDIIYSSMPANQECSVTTTTAVSPLFGQGYPNVYVSCRNSLGNEQNTSQNIDITSLTVDYTAPETNDTSTTAIHTPGYVVNITEYDNVDSDPATLYCTDTSNTCTPSTPIDNNGQINFSTRGVSYLRYNFTDDVGNVQNVIKTININHLPTMSSASDNAADIIQGGTNKNISTVSLETDSGQTMTLFVCKSLGAASTGCTTSQYCTSSGTANISCAYTSDTDSASHEWYSYIFDSSDEGAAANPLNGYYTTDSTAPIITLISPANITYTQNSLTLTIVVNEALKNAFYSINNGINQSLSNISLLEYTAVNSTIANGNYYVVFHANDSYGNMISSDAVHFTINSAPGDTTPPAITIMSPVNLPYSTSSSTLFNITSDESLNWAGYKINAGAITNLGNSSSRDWNSTVNLNEGWNNITFYANDTSSNQNNKTIIFWVDLTNPQIVSHSCTPNPVNDLGNVSCISSFSDNLGLNYYILGYNATGIWQNSTGIPLSGLLASVPVYEISSGNTTPGTFAVETFVYDLSGRSNNTLFYVSVADDTAPKIFNITYLPNTTDDLDPYVNVKFNATIIEDYLLGAISLMYKLASSSAWSSLAMENQTAITYGSPIVYNTSITFENGTWQFRVNATDFARNENLSDISSLVITNETTQVVTSTIPSIKSFYYSGRTENNSLGELILNNTGDSSMTFNITLSSSSIGSRLILNDTGNATASYSFSPKQEPQPDHICKHI